MDKKVILISIDGMRPDGLRECSNPFVKEMERLCAYTYNGRSMMPSVTLPCHFTMTHSVTPQRHGILTNTYIPQVRPVKGIFERVKNAGGISAMYYGWEPLRDVALPGTLEYAVYMDSYSKESTDTLLTDEALKRMREDKPDFVFLYMVETDEKGGHDNGWMSEEYLRRISVAIDNVKRVFDEFKDEYYVIVVADHGGHNRSHGTDAPEDMTIPFFFYGEDIEPGEISRELSLLDITPTIAKILGVPMDNDWEGEAVF